MPIPAARGITTVMTVGQSGVEDGQGTVGPVICAAGVPAAEMACGVDPACPFWRGATSRKTQGWWQQGQGGGGRPRHHHQWRGRQQLHHKCPKRTAMAITRAPGPALASVVGVTGKGGDGKDVIVLIAIVIGRGIETNNN